LATFHGGWDDSLWYSEDVPVPESTEEAREGLDWLIFFNKWERGITASGVSNSSGQPAVFVKKAYFGAKLIAQYV
jgi:hypothetical protein